MTSRTSLGGLRIHKVGGFTPNWLVFAPLPPLESHESHLQHRFADLVYLKDPSLAADRREPSALTAPRAWIDSNLSAAQPAWLYFR